MKSTTCWRKIPTWRMKALLITRTRSMKHMHLRVSRAIGMLLLTDTMALQRQELSLQMPPTVPGMLLFTISIRMSSSLPLFHLPLSPIAIRQHRLPLLHQIPWPRVTNPHINPMRVLHPSSLWRLKEVSREEGSGWRLGRLTTKIKTGHAKGLCRVAQKQSIV